MHRSSGPRVVLLYSFSSCIIYCLPFDLNSLTFFLSLGRLIFEKAKEWCEPWSGDLTNVSDFFSYSILASMRMVIVIFLFPLASHTLARMAKALVRLFLFMDIYLISKLEKFEYSSFNRFTYFHICAMFGFKRTQILVDYQP